MFEVRICFAIRVSDFGFFRNPRLLKARKHGMLLDAMKNRIGVLILVVVCVGLVIGIIGIKRQADTEKAKDITSIQNLSNNWNVARNELIETKQVNDELRKDL